MKKGMIILGFLVAAMASSLYASGSYTLDLTKNDSSQLPSWIHVTETVRTEDSALSSLRFDVTAPEDVEALAVTIIYKESTGGFLRALSVSGDKEDLLSSNLYEGGETWNRRTLLLSGDELKSALAFVLESGGETTGVAKVQFKSLTSHEILSDVESREASLLLSKGQVFFAEETSGSHATYAEDEYKRGVLRAVLASVPETLPNGDGYAFDIKFSPHHTRLEGEFEGLPLSDPVAVIVNGKAVGFLHVETPDLDDPGYMENEDGTLDFVGWRKGVLVLPTDAIVEGENTVAIRWGEEELASISARNVVLSIKISNTPQ